MAQALHYAAWLDTATKEQVIGFYEDHLQKPLDEAFEDHFGEPMHPIVCRNHRVVLVAPRLDSGAELIISYLAERHGVDINAVFFTYTKVGDREVLGRAFLVADEVTHDRSQTKRPALSQLLAMAEEKRIIQLVDTCRRMKDHWDERPAWAYGGSLRYWGKVPDGRHRMLFGINIAGGYAQPPNGQHDIWIPTKSMAEATGIDESTIRQTLKDRYNLAKDTPFDCVVRLKSAPGG